MLTNFRKTKQNSEESKRNKQNVLGIFSYEIIIYCLSIKAKLSTLKESSSKSTKISVTTTSFAFLKYGKNLRSTTKKIKIDRFRF